jgi:geranylgeranyl diphosphate synthase type II
MVTDIYDVLDVPSLCQKNIETLYAEARRLWESLSLSEERKSALWDFAVSMLKRKS